MSTASQEIRPRRVWYAVAAIVLAGGIVTFAILLVGFITGMTGIAQSMTRVVVPGSADITLDKPGVYTIFHEYESVVAGRVYSSPGGLAGLACTLTDKATGGNIAVTATSASETYSMGSYAGRSVFDFNVPSAGVYTLSAQYPGGAAGPQAVLSIGQGFMGSIFGLMFKMFAAIGTLLLSLLLSILIFVVTIVRRNLARRRLREGAG